MYSDTIGKIILIIVILLAIYGLGDIVNKISKFIKKLTRGRDKSKGDFLG